MTFIFTRFFLYSLCIVFYSLGESFLRLFSFVLTFFLVFVILIGKLTLEKGFTIMIADISNLNIGNLKLDKGLVRKDVKMFAWDSIRECNGDASAEGFDSDTICPAHNLCSYVKRGKCAVQVKYLESLYSSILSSYSYLDEAMLWKIGMQIVPLYLQLVKLQIIELSLGSPVYNSEKGTVLVHPVYREIRETLKVIHLMWKDLDLAFNFKEKPKFIDNEGEEEESAKKKLYDQGDPQFYKKLISSDNGSQKGIIR